jgi:GntR family phosphonate transport system transcriptional regulator
MVVAGEKSKSKTVEIDRKSGVALWRQIADALQMEIYTGRFSALEKLPTEADLAHHFAVNRHTVRAAIAELKAQKLLRAEQGRGTFINRRRRLLYPISKRTRFSQALSSQGSSRQIRVLGSDIVKPPDLVRERLQLTGGALALRLDTLSSVDDLPVAVSTSWFDASRFAGLDTLVGETASITKALQHFGVTDYLRSSTDVAARAGTASECEALAMPAGSIVLAVESINVDMDRTPIEAGFTHFAADRVTLQFGAV